MKNIGLLGGGQLARMLALKAHQIGHKPFIYTQNLKDPAAQVTQETQTEAKPSAAGLLKFFKSVDVVTVESEFFDAELLAEAEKASKTPCYPSSQNLLMLQDRLTQKEALVSAQLPTLPFVEVSSLSDLQAAHTQLGKRLVLKARKMGYDGYGTHIARKGAHSAALKLALKTSPYGFIAEPFLPFQRELAVILARSKDGSAASFPWVQTHQENSRCLWVKGPVQLLPAQALLLKRLHDFLKKLKYVGVMAFEFFETKSKELLINELAPRVHNSGHATMNAFSADQFQLHLECVLGQKLQPPQLESPGFAMYNLLGSGVKSPKLVSAKGVHLHWYGKEESRKGRKMGHLNAVAAHPDVALRRLKRTRKDFRV